MKKLTFKTSILSLAALCGLTLTLGSCANEDIAQNGNGTDNDKNLTIFSTGEEPATRTSMESNGTFYWEAGDKIWVKDDNGVWRQSSNSPSGKTASFKFKVPGKFTKGNTYKVYYPGQNGNQNQVTISANQTQTEPNSTAHFGTSGDCGTADAAWSNSKNGFAFTLDHQAAYLIFQPYTNNTVLHDCYLTKIEVTSDNDIASTYTLASSGILTGTGSGKQIILTTKSSDYRNANYKGFPLTNTSASIATNGAYMVIKPGIHTLKIRYWIRDIATGTEGTITKTLSAHNFAKNEYVNMETNLEVKVYDGHNYYMWDAQNNYWAGHEWDSANPWQPTLMSQAGNPNYPQAGDALGRYQSTFQPASPARYYAQTSLFKNLPNANEMAWYCMNGDPRWDKDELWSTMGHLYKGGVWIKKRAFISGFSAEHAPDGIDIRLNREDFNGIVSPDLPSPSEINKFFYLPATGRYFNGSLGGVGNVLQCWSSSGANYYVTGSYHIQFNSYHVDVAATMRTYGIVVQTFE